MGKEEVVYIHTGVDLAIKKYKIMSSVGKWTEILMLSEISQTQKVKVELSFLTYRN